MEIFDYDNILLLPRKCRVESRSECDTRVELGGRSFRIPVVPANMKTVVDERICTWLAQNGYFYVMHRFDLDNVQFVKKMHSQDCFASISLGVKPADYATVERFVAEGITPEYITIDVAHGHSDSVKNMVQYLKAKLPHAIVIAGNVGTPEAVIDLENWGADATKVGIGPGKVCITKLKTGFGTGGWQLSAVKWCARVATKPLIADGGIRYSGDITKAIAAGAHAVMIGGLFAGESMFHAVRDASKVALVGLVERFHADGDPRRLVDVQWATDHLRRLGAQEGPRELYLQRLAEALQAPQVELGA